jgi:ATP-dependent Clp protease, protease subunit
MQVAIRSAASDVVEIDVFDDIGVDFWTGEGVTAKQVRDALKGTKPKTIKLAINSGGGDSFEGTAIYNVLRQYAERGTHIVGEVMGLAASAASTILAAADEVSIPANAAIMIHEAWSRATGNAADLEKRAALLRQVNETVADTYVRSAIRRGAALTREDALELMAAETWMFGSEAVERGFADHVTDALEVAASVDLSHSTRAAEMRARLPVPALTSSAQETKSMAVDTVTTQVEPEAATAPTDATAEDTRVALALASQAEKELAEVRSKLEQLEAERALIEANSTAQAAEVARLSSDINRREVEALIGSKLYPAEREPMVALRSKDPELFAALMSARPAITLTADITGGDKPANAVAQDPDSQLAAFVRGAGKDE